MPPQLDPKKLSIRQFAEQFHLVAAGHESGRED
jgi:hypothetical protein